MRHFRILGLITIVLSTWCGPAAHAELRGAAAPRISSGRSRTGFACSAARPTSSVTSPQHAVTACWRPSGAWRARPMAAAGPATWWSGCASTARGKLLEVCDRDGVREVYLSPRDHRVGVVLAGTVPANEGCVWSFDDGDGPARQVNATCTEEVKAHLPYGRPSTVSVDIILLDGTALRLVSEIQVRDVLIAGMGDSIAAGEGNPDRRGAALRRRLLLQAL